MSTKLRPLAAWPEFMEAIRQRLEKGKKEYGDSSFTRPPPELAEEIEEEILDICGWAFFLWLRMHNIKSFLTKIKEDKS